MSYSVCGMANPSHTGAPMSTPNTIAFVSHGGGPLPLLGDPSHQDLVEHLQTMAQSMSRPRAIVVISAHWEADVVTITSSKNTTLLYDYYGFPPESYRIQYPTPGAPQLSSALQETLAGAGIPTAIDASRGLDHGVFVPLKIMYPGADIPVVQVSLNRDLCAQTHLALGEALQGLANQGLLVLGSGFTFHNMPAFFDDSAEIRNANQAFEAWLEETCGQPYLSHAQRMQRLLHWEQAPHARFCHPREEHLLPLLVCCAMAGRPATVCGSVNVLRKKAGMYVWQ